MRKTLPLLLVFLGASASFAQQIQVVPGGLASVEGNSSSIVPFGIGSIFFQQVFAASEFASIGAPTGLIQSIWFRLDANAGTNMLANYPGLTIAMSTTSRSPDGLSLNFADNSGSDARIVYSASRILLADYTPGLQPQPFLVGFQFSTPFAYVPAQGNLLLEIRSVNGMFTPVPLDAQSLLGDSVSSVFDTTGAGLTAAADTFGLITRFDIVPVPEPATWLLAGAGLGAVGTLKSLKWRALPIAVNNQGPIHRENSEFHRSDVV